METRFRLKMGGHQIELRHGVTTLGRADECTICLDDERISRVHAEIEVDGAQAVLSDKGSRNGTFLNGIQVVQPTLVKDGDVIRIGQHEMKVQMLQSVAPSGRVRRDTMHGNQSEHLYAAEAAFEMSSEVTAEADLLRKALQMGRYEDAERLLKARVARLLTMGSEVSSQDPKARLTMEGLLTLAQHTMDAVWLDRLLRLHAALHWWMDLKMEGEVTRLLRAIGKTKGSGLKDYIRLWEFLEESLEEEQRHRIQLLRELSAYVDPAAE